MATSTQDFVVSGYVYQAGNKVLNGLVRVRNLNVPDVINVVRLGRLHDGSSNSPTTDGYFDAWWVSGGSSSAPIVANVGDVMEFIVYPLDAVADINNPAELLVEPVQAVKLPLFVAVNSLPIIQSQIDVKIMTFDVYAPGNVLPDSIVILPENKELGYNLQYTNNESLRWAWSIPSDPENNAVHFKIEWSKDPAFPINEPGTVGTATTLPTDPTRTLFKYEYNPDVFATFPTDGVVGRAGWRCLFETSVGSSSSRDGEYYWRVRATDNL